MSPKAKQGEESVEYLWNMTDLCADRPDAGKGQEGLDAQRGVGLNHSKREHVRNSSVS